jgi:predicted GNAT family N-acyltransferase
MKRGLLLIDRGSKEREAEEELEKICLKVKEKGNYVFSEYCFLEVVPPYIEDGIDHSSLLSISRQESQSSCY